MDWIAVVSRWTHVGTAIVLVGGTVFLRFVFTPAVERLSEAERTSVTSHVLSLWKRFIHIGILLFLVSGFYNYLVVALPSHKGDKLYHPLIGTKILLGFGMFFIASALVGRSAKFEVMRRNAKFWQTVILVLAAVIVGVSGFAKVTLKGKPREESVRLVNAIRTARPVSLMEKSTIAETREPARALRCVPGTIATKLDQRPSDSFHRDLLIASTLKSGLAHYLRPFHCSAA